MTRIRSKNKNMTLTSESSDHEHSMDEARNAHGTVNSRCRTLSCLTNKKRTLVLRLSFVLSMIAAAGICGGIAYVVTKHLEEDVAEQTYESVAASALEEAQAIAKRKQYGAQILTSVLGFAFPQANMWPMIGLRGYPQIAQRVAKLSSTSGHGPMVIVQPDELETFENHAQQLYQEFGYPETSGWSDFGFGVYGTSPDSPYEDKRFHDTTGNTTYGSPNNILVPFLQHSNTYSNPNLLLMNLHQQPFRGKVIDSMIACGKEAEAQNVAESPSCFMVTGFTEIFVRPGPAAVLFEPIYPVEDPSKIVGFVGTSIHWEEVLTNVVPDYVDGIDCVISDGERSFTYVINNGVPMLVGEGDFHDRAFSDYGHSVILNEHDTGALASHTYTLTVYPTNLMFEEFRTNSPIYVTVGFVAVIFWCIGVFFLYDMFMKRKAHQRKKILAMKRRFVRFVSHEIRTPLNVVCMGLELLQAELREKLGADKMNHNDPDKTDTDPGSTDDVATLFLDLTADILENTQNAVSVLNDLLNYDKIESGTFRLEFGNVNIWQLVEKTVSEFSIQARNRNVAVDFVVNSDAALEIPPDIQRLGVVGDDIRLTQAIRNLISNALKFAPVDGDGKITIKADYDPSVLTPQDKETKELESNIPVGSIRISVEDNGVGLSKERLRLLFTEGMQFDANKLQSGGGSGLGLCITKEIIEQHGGSIEAFSDGPGKGAMFVLQLPLYRILSDINEGNTENTEAGGVDPMTVTATTSHHILVVDDSISNSKMLVRLLKRAGHRCLVARDGQEAIDKYTQSIRGDDSNAVNGENLLLPFDTILMDFEMPVMNGPEATQRLREMGCNSLIFGITGNVLAEDVALFKASGANEVLPKPVSMGAIDACWSKAEHKTKPLFPSEQYPSV